MWLCDLTQKLCNRHGLRVIVRHYPPAASKCSRIEHRLFSRISRNGQGVPLETYDTVLNPIYTARPGTGATVVANLDSKTYQKGQEVTLEEVRLPSMRRHRTLPEWNYTVRLYNQNRLRKL